MGIRVMLRVCRSFLCSYVLGSVRETGKFFYHLWKVQKRGKLILNRKSGIPSISSIRHAGRQASNHGCEYLVRTWMRRRRGVGFPAALLLSLHERVSLYHSAGLLSLHGNRSGFPRSSATSTKIISPARNIVQKLVSSRFCSLTKMVKRHCSDSVKE